MSVGIGANPAAGISSNSSVGTSSAVIVPAGTYSAWVTIQNTHALNKLFLSFTNPATTSDYTLSPGASITLPFGLANALYGIGGATGTTYALIGF